MKTFGSMLKHFTKKAKIRRDLDNYINVLLATSSAKNSSIETDHFVGLDVLLEYIRFSGTYNGIYSRHTFWK